MKKNSEKKPSEWCSLESLPDDHSIWLAGSIADPVFDAVANNEAGNVDDDGFVNGAHVGAALLDWDEFAAVHAAFRAEVNAFERKQRALKRNGKPPSKGGAPRTLPDRTCKQCGAVFRPKMAKRFLCSVDCSRLWRSKHSETGPLMDRLQAITGLSRAVIGHRIMRGWTEERIIAKPLQKKKRVTP